MSDTVLQVLLVAVAAAVVGGVALGTRRWQRPGHPPVDVGLADLPAGIIVFTSTDCSTCHEALAAVKALDVPVREVTWELEPQLLESAGVSAVPLTVLRRGDGTVVDQIVGVPSARRLRRAVAAWAESKT